MKKTAITVILLLTIFISGAAWSETVELKLATFDTPTGFANSKIFGPWAESLNKEAKDMFHITIYAGGTLGRNPLKQLQLARDGVADISWIIPSYTPGIFLDDAIVEVPFLAKTAFDSSLAFYKMWEKGLLRGYDLVVPLMIAGAQQYAIHTTFPVKSPKDLKGKKIRAIGKMQNYMAKALDFVPVGMPVTEVAESLSRDLLQGTLNEWNGARTFKIDEVAKYHCMVPLGTVTFLMGMNKEKFNSLSPEAQAILIKHREPLVRDWGRKMDEDLAKYHQKILNDKQHHVYTPSGKDLEEWKTVLQPAVEEWTKAQGNGKELINAYEEELIKARQEE